MRIYFVDEHALEMKSGANFKVHPKDLDRSGAGTVLAVVSSMILAEANVSPEVGAPSNSRKISRRSCSFNHETNILLG